MVYQRLKNNQNILKDKNDMFIRLIIEQTRYTHIYLISKDSITKCAVFVLQMTVKQLLVEFRHNMESLHLSIIY